MVKYEYQHYRLASMPYAQTHVEFIFRGGTLETVRLFSYSTLIADVQILEREKLSEKNPYFMVVSVNPGNGSDSYNCCDRTFSPTTARHINRFTREFFGRNLYYSFKQSAERDKPIYLFESDYNILSECVNDYMWRGKRFYGNY